MEKEDKKNAEFKRRILWLIPFNFGIIWGTLRYCANVNNIAKKFWPGKQKVKITNLLFIATI